MSGTGISSGGALVNTGGSASLAGTFTLNANSSIGGAGDITLGNVAQSGGTRTLTKVGAGTLTLSGTNSYTGTTTISEGTLEVSGTSAGVAYVLSGSGNPTLKLSNTSALPTTATIAGANSFALAGTVDLAVAGTHTLGAYNRGNINFTSSSGSPTTLIFTNPSAITGTVNSARTFSNDSPDLGMVFNNTLDIGGDAAANITITGSGSTTVTGGMISTGDGVRGLIKNGGGTLTLNGPGSYAGTTKVNNGTLLVNNTTGSATGSGDLNIASGATLGGSGIIAGATTTLAGTLAPGNSPGTITIDGGSLELVAGGDYALAYSWTLFSTESTISGFDAGDFVVND